jgi:hypothetical protein
MHVESDRDMGSLPERGMGRGIVAFAKVIDRIAGQEVRHLGMGGKKAGTNK